ncbi:IS66-like element accessory protein TnpA [Ralstonia solanacearum]|uniref:Transposase n=1 Tax=Ralstonia solanacearum TaxID=305 RepID=A0AAE3T7J2_RALSL|nr:transposase [Ralstonia solanacearum]
MTTEDELDYLPLKVTHVGDNGKRTFDAEDKRRLIEACRQPGVSLSGMALKAGVNANQLHKWVYGRGRKRRRDNELAALEREADVRSAFIPVVAATAGLNLTASPARLTAQLPNGVTVTLECSGQDASLVKAMIEALGAR